MIVKAMFLRYSTGIFMLINVKRIVSLVRLILNAFQKYKLRLILLLSLGLLGGFSEAIGISAAIPLFNLMSGQSLEGTDSISNAVYYIFKTLHLPLAPPFLLLFILTLFIIKAVVQFSTRYINARVVSDFEERTRSNLLAQTLKAQWSYLLNRKSGYLEAILMNDVERSGTVFNLVSSSMTFITGFLTYAAVAFGISVPITLLTIAFGGTLFIILKPVFYRSRKLFETTTQLHKDLHHNLAESFSGVKIIKATGQESAALKKARQYFQIFKQAKVKTALYRQSSLAIIEPAGFILIAILFMASYRSPSFSIASFAVIMYLIQKIFTFIQSTQNHLHTISEFAPSLKSILQYKKQISQNREKDSGTMPFVYQKSLTFEDVHFAYDPRRPVLRGISFSITRGSVIGIMGPSGSGKTTIADLLLRLFHPDTGAIRIDGILLDDIRIAALRERISYVPQEAFLLNESIRNNIRFFDDNLSDETLIEVAKKANIYETIMSLPDGFDTVIGDRGIKLSGGQRQRIALARALARKPDIIILDEATSAIDGESEAMIQKAILNLRKETTIIIIAHRFSTIKDVDNLIILRDGVIGEQGSLEALSRDPNSYLYRIQAAMGDMITLQK